MRVSAAVYGVNHEQVDNDSVTLTAVVVNGRKQRFFTAVIFVGEAKRLSSGFVSYVATFIK